MVKGWGKSSPPFSQDTFAKYSPILMVAINVPDHSVENKIFSQPPPVLGGDGIGLKNSHASENTLDRMDSLFKFLLGRIVRIKAGENLVAVI